MKRSAFGIFYNQLEWLVTHIIMGHDMEHSSYKLFPEHYNYFLNAKAARSKLILELHDIG